MEKSKLWQPTRRIINNNEVVKPQCNQRCAKHTNFHTHRERGGEREGEGEREGDTHRATTWTVEKPKCKTNARIEYEPSDKAGGGMNATMWPQPTVASLVRCSVLGLGV